jgi:formylglycine-generating enzyme required for sulfatase activity
MTPRTLATELQDAWHRSDDLFGRLRDLNARPIALRHPFVFYLGHLPAFAWNQLAVAALGKAPTGPLDHLFAFGIDPESEADVSGPTSFPPVHDIWTYRDRIRDALLAMLPELLEGEGPLCEKGRAARLVLEHELMHHETLLYMVQMSGLGIYDDVPEGGDGVGARLVEVPEGHVQLGADFDTLDFGWDNEFPPRTVHVPAFRIDSHAVRNSDWQAFVAAGGPEPIAWADGCVRTCCGPVPFDVARGWPVQVSHDQARAYAEWRGRRLPTEAELARVRHQPEGANVDFAHHLPKPVGHAPDSPSGLNEVVGNGWEHTDTVWKAHEGFHPWVDTYAGYSADFFDGQHHVVSGGSWATAGRFLRPSFRNWYRHDYPYVFSKFRTVLDR